MGEIKQSVKVNGVRVRALMDSGATDNFLSERVAKRVGLFLEKKYSFATADGKRHSGRIAHATIDVYRKMGSTSVVVTNMLPQDGYDLILGQAFLQDNEVELDFSKDAMRYGSRQPRIRRIGRL